MSTISYSSLPPVSLDFLMDFDSNVPVLGGPVGTGKTISQCLKLMIGAVSIVPDSEGVRRTRFLVVRKRYGDLEASFVKDMETIVAPGLFKLTGKKSPMYAKIEFPYSDSKGVGTRVESEIYMYAFENPEDVLKIKSLKFTAAFIIEAQELADSRMYMSIFERLGRFPTPENASDDDDQEINTAITWELPNGTAAQGQFMSMDFNYPSVRHHFKKYMVDKNIPDSRGITARKLYAQPPTHHFVPGATEADGGMGVEGTYKGEKGMFVRNPKAVPYIKHNKWAYWENLLREMMGDDALIQQNILAEFGDYTSGKPVYPMFRREQHVADRPLQYIPGLPVFVGVDNGFNNAWLFFQQERNGRIALVHEIVNTGDDAKTIAAAVKDDITPYINRELPFATTLFVVDQAFYQQEGGRGSRQIDILNDAGFNVEPCPEKFTSPMRDICSVNLSAQQIIISPTCIRTIDALAGGFHYPVDRRTGQYREEPNQESEHSHPVNAFEFVITRLSKVKGRRRKRGGARSKKKYDYL